MFDVFACAYVDGFPQFKFEQLAAAGGDAMVEVPKLLGWGANNVNETTPELRGSSAPPPSSA